MILAILGRVSYSVLICTYMYVLKNKLIDPSAPDLEEYI